MTKTTILWDNDGVLVDTERWYYEATRITLEQLGVELPLDTYLVNMASGYSAWHQARANGVTDTEIAQHKARRSELYQHFIRTEDIDIPGVSDVLADLARCYAMAIVTTSRREDFELIHGDREIVSHMAFVLASGDYPRAKPHPDPYLSALARFGVPAADAIAVEDSERGLRAALAAGLDCVVVDNEFVRGQDLSAATYRVEHLGELPELLADL